MLLKNIATVWKFISISEIYRAHSGKPRALRLKCTPDTFSVIVTAHVKNISIGYNVKNGVKSESQTKICEVFFRYNIFGSRDWRKLLCQNGTFWVHYYSMCINSTDYTCTSVFAWTRKEIKSKSFKWDTSTCVSWLNGWWYQIVILWYQPCFCTCQ